MTFEEKNKILSFINEIDNIHLPGYILNFNYDAIDGFETRIQQTFECLFREVFLPKNFTIDVKGENVTPFFSVLMTSDNQHIASVRRDVLKLSHDDCEVLLENAHERNKFTHGAYKISNESIKEQLSKILFKALKNAYQAKTSKMLDLTFDDFLIAFKYSREKELEESKIKAEKKAAEQERLAEEAISENKALKEKYALYLEDKAKTIKKTATKKSVVRNSSIKEEIKYKKIYKNSSYVIPKEIGQDIELVKSPQIEIAIDFLNQGWFSEAIKEANDINHLLAKYIVFLANNNLKDIQDLVNSTNYKSFLNELFLILGELPKESATKLIKELIDLFFEIKKDFDKKTYIFSKLISLNIHDLSGVKQDYEYFLIDSYECFPIVKKGFELYFSSFKDRDYIIAVEETLDEILRHRNFDLVFNVKNELLKDLNSPKIIKTILLAQARVDSFNDIGKGIDNVFDSQYLSLLLNYDYYNNVDEFNKLKDSVVSSIKNQRYFMADHRKINAIVLLEVISPYLSQEEYDELISIYIPVFKKDTIWPFYTNECLSLLKLIKNDISNSTELLESWFDDSNIGLLDFYKEAVLIIKSANNINGTILKIDIHLTLSLTKEFRSFNEKPNKISSNQIETYLGYTGDYVFITKLVKVLPFLLNEDNAEIYADSFEILLPYCKDEGEQIFEYLKNMASSLVTLGLFKRAEKFYRYMLGLNINSSICYWGLLFCESKTKNVEELSKTNNLYENELFQETLHLSKLECPEIYKECLSVYSSHKEQTKQKIEKRRDKRKFATRLILFLIGTAITIGYFVLGIKLIKSLGWLYLLIAFLLIIAMMVVNALAKTKSKNKVIASIIIYIAVFSSALFTLAGIHIGKAVNAENNYISLKSAMENFDSDYKINNIQNTIKKIPFTYKDIGTIQEEADRLENCIKNSSNGRDKFNRVWSFDANHDKWNCRKYYYNYRFHDLIINSAWKIDETDNELYYYNDKDGYWFNPTTELPNNKDKYKDYYFYTETCYYDNEGYFVNQYMRFGYVNKLDRNDKFIAYTLGHFGISKSGKMQIQVHCYSDDSDHVLTYNREYSGG